MVEIYQGGRHAPRHVLQGHHPHEVPVLQSPYEHVQEVDEGKLDESREDRHEADDDENIQSSGIAHLRFGLPSEADGDNSQDSRGSQLCSGRCLLALLCLDEPECDPGTHDDDVQGNVDLQYFSHTLSHHLVSPWDDLQNVEADGSPEVELQKDDGLATISSIDDLLTILPGDHLVLSQLQRLVHTEGGVVPGVEDLVISEAKAPNIEGASLGGAILPEILLLLHLNLPECPGETSSGPSDI